MTRFDRTGIDVANSTADGDEFTVRILLLPDTMVTGYRVNRVHFGMKFAYIIARTLFRLLTMWPGPPPWLAPPYTGTRPSDTLEAELPALRGAVQ
jgi:hypothetical protein